MTGNGRPLIPYLRQSRDDGEVVGGGEGLGEVTPVEGAA